MKSPRGFTLVEIMVSMVILSLLAAGFFSAMVSSRLLISRSKMRLVAVETARQAIENMRKDIRADTWDSGNLSVHGWWACPAGSVVLPAGYACNYKVESVGAADYRKVTVEVKWNASTV